MSEWDKRQLCPDGACTGVVGADGKCRVCGKQGEGPSSLVHRPSSEGDEDDDDFDDDEDADYEDDGEDEDEDEDSVKAMDEGRGTMDPSEWGKRKLCDDGACTGVIGDNGKCKVCGK